MPIPLEEKGEPVEHSTLVRSAVSRHPKFTFWGLLIFSLAYFLLAKLGMSVFSLKPSNITLLWLPSGLALVMCLQWGWRAVPGILIASFAANIAGLGGFNQLSAVLHTLISASADASAGIIAAALFRRYLPQGLARTQDLLPFAVAVCLVTTGITSAILAANLVWGGYIPTSEAVSFIRMLVLADSLGILLILPIYQGWKNDRSLSRKNWIWLLACLLFLSAVFVGVLNGLSYTIYFILPVLLMLSFNVGMLPIGLVLAVAMTGITSLTAAHMGPFIVESAHETNLRLMAFLFSSSLTILGVALQNRQLQISETLAESLQDVAKTDSLTGLFNRRAFFTIVEQEVQYLSAKDDGHYSIAMLDLDHSKEVNDTHGHAAGDLVLRTFSRLLKGHCRDVDVPVRLGGEEFAVFFPSCSIQQSKKVMERVRKALEKEVVKFNDKKIGITVSIGISAPNSQGELLNDVLFRADHALYAAKAKGRNIIVTEG